MTGQLALASFLTILAAFLVLPFNVYADIRHGLAAYYPMEGRAKVLRDATGHGMDGEIITAKRTRDGKFGNGLLFDHPTHSAVIHRYGRLMVQRDFAVSFWVKPKKLDFAGENRAVYKDDQYNVDILNGAGHVEVHAALVWRGTAPGKKLTLDEWHHIVGTLHRGTITYYTNAVAMGNARGIGNIILTDSRIQLGFMGQNAFVGVMDDLRIYERGLDAKKVQELFEYEPPHSVPSLDSLATTWGTMKR